MERTEAILRRFFAGPVLPRFHAGHVIGPDAYIDAICLLGQLHGLGVTAIADKPLTEWMRSLLTTVDGERTQTFGSFRLGETLLQWGPFEGNALLEGMSPAQRQNLADACDTSHIYKPDGTIGEWSTNYWMVLARGEFARQRLGLLTDTTILEASLEQCRRLLLADTADYFDDSATKVGRYDTYAMGVMSICGPFTHRMPRELVQSRLARDVRILETLAMENGACVAWGRSIGVLSVLGTIGHAITALHHSLAADAGRIVALAANAAAQLPAWFRDDLVAAHRDRMTFGYRGPQRLMQMSLDCLNAAAGAARGLRDLPPSPPPAGPLFPPRDEIIRFNPHNAGVWMFRNEHMSFQLPFVSAWLGADYVPWLHSPGVFDNPVDCAMRFGVPVVLLEGKAFGPGELPASVDKRPGELTLTYSSLMEEVAGGWMPNPQWQRRPASLSLNWRIEGRGVHLRQRLSLPHAPQGVAIHIPQAQRAMAMNVVHASVPFSQHVTTVEGIGQYRSCWSQLTAIHELHLQPATDVDVHFTISI